MALLEWGGGEAIVPLRMEKKGEEAKYPRRARTCPFQFIPLPQWDFSSDPVELGLKMN